MKSILKKKLKGNIGKTKALWSVPKFLGLLSNTFLNKDDKISFDDKTNANPFKEFFCNLASDLVAKLPSPSNKFGIHLVRNFYQNMLDLLPSKFKF